MDRPAAPCTPPNTIRVKPSATRARRLVIIPPIAAINPSNSPPTISRGALAAPIQYGTTASRRVSGRSPERLTVRMNSMDRAPANPPVMARFSVYPRRHTARTSRTILRSTPPTRNRSAAVSGVMLPVVDVSVMPWGTVTRQLANVACVSDNVGAARRRPLIPLRQNPSSPRAWAYTNSIAIAVLGSSGRLTGIRISSPFSCDRTSSLRPFS